MEWFWIESGREAERRPQMPPSLSARLGVTEFCPPAVPAWGGHGGVTDQYARQAGRYRRRRERAPRCGGGLSRCGRRRLRVASPVVGVRRGLASPARRCRMGLVSPVSWSLCRSLKELVVWSPPPPRPPGPSRGRPPPTGRRRTLADAARRPQDDRYVPTETGHLPLDGGTSPAVRSSPHGTTGGAMGEGDAWPSWSHTLRR
jgi:hypothetical protein